ncbi:GntR family transcriptional regulator [Virgibacillus halophilus]|uniref:GntR family transcriptional regulator n=1 Tax=Tigheibacillus halophilus TaxID=361280 RepID=UPI0036283BBD
MNMRVSRKKGPLYSQIRDIVRDRILHGVYAIGENIPPEPELEREFNVSKITVRNAIKELVQEGYLETRSGKGTKVIRNITASKLSRGKRFTETLVEQGHKVQKQILNVNELENQPGTEKYHLFGKYCFSIERLYFLDDRPYIHYMHYVSSQLMNRETAVYQDQSLYKLIEDKNIDLKTFRDQFDVVDVPANVAKKLEMDDDRMILKRERYAYDENDQLIEYSVGYYNTSMQKYLIHYDV